MMKTVARDAADVNSFPIVDEAAARVNTHTLPASIPAATAHGSGTALSQGRLSQLHTHTHTHTQTYLRLILEASLEVKHLV